MASGALLLSLPFTFSREPRLTLHSLPPPLPLSHKHLPKQNYEVIGSPTPSISVPTHWSKVILAARAPRGQDPRKTTEREISLAGFVMPNEVIPDNAPLESFLVPGQSLFLALSGRLLAVFHPHPDPPLRYPSVSSLVEQIEKFSGLELLSAPVKQTALGLCTQTVCQPVIRRFDDARKKLDKAPVPLIGGGRA